jgi:hypothetical protein
MAKFAVFNFSAPGEVLSTAPHPPKPGHISQRVNARDFAYSTCCTLQPRLARQCRGLSFGLESTAEVLLTKPSTRTSWASRFYWFCRKKRADERTRTAYPCSLRVITQALQGFAGPCKTRISKQLSLHRFAGCCTVLRSRWCQSGVNSIYLLNSRYRASLQVVLQDAGCRLRRGTKHFYRNASASSHI